MYELSFKINHSNAISLSDYLTTQFPETILTLENDQAPLIHEPALHSQPYWEHMIAKIFLPFDISLDAFESALQQTFDFFSLSRCEIQSISEKDWTMPPQIFKPIVFPKRLTIYPSWEIPSTFEKDRIYLEFDPGLGFGTGEHPTTFLCLNWLDGFNLEEKTLFDYGCGSGILSLAALKLGAKNVWALDMDPQALEATQANFLRNNIVPDRYEILAPSHHLLIQADIVMANILLSSLIELFDRLNALVSPNGLIVLSGVMSHQQEILRKIYEKSFQMVRQTEKENWICWVGQKI